MLQVFCGKRFHQKDNILLFPYPVGPKTLKAHQPTEETLRFLVVASVGLLSMFTVKLVPLWTFISNLDDQKEPVSCSSELSMKTVHVWGQLTAV